MEQCKLKQQTSQFVRVSSASKTPQTLPDHSITRACTGAQISEVLPRDRLTAARACIRPLRPRRRLGLLQAARPPTAAAPVAAKAL